LSFDNESIFHAEARFLLDNSKLLPSKEIASAMLLALLFLVAGLKPF